LALIDDHLPACDVHETHSTRVAAAPAATIEAADELTLREVPLVVALMAVRGIPKLLTERRVPGLGDRVSTQLEQAGFTRVAHSEDEFVFGVVGRFWEPTSGIAPLPAAGLQAFTEPGAARAVMNMRVEPDGDGCVLSTETRVQATDEGGRRSFLRYWRIIRPGSALIRVVWLRAIRRRAERGPRA